METLTSSVDAPVASDPTQIITASIVTSFAAATVTVDATDAEPFRVRIHLGGTTVFVPTAEALALALAIAQAVGSARRDA